MWSSGEIGPDGAPLSPSAGPGAARRVRGGIRPADISKAYRRITTDVAAPRHQDEGEVFNGLLMSLDPR
jgi:hypothetical protein